MRNTFELVQNSLVLAQWFLRYPLNLKYFQISFNHCTRHSFVNTCFSQNDNFSMYRCRRVHNLISLITSKPRLLNLILINLLVRWPTGAAIVRPPNIEYTQSIGACWEKLPKNSENNITAYDYEFSHGNFFHSMIFTIFSKYLSTEKNSYRQKLS